MAHITLSLPNELYRLMKKYRDVNWSEVARNAIIRKLLILKANDEGLSREEFNLLLEIRDLQFKPVKYDLGREENFLEKIREREVGRRRVIGEDE